MARATATERKQYRSTYLLAGLLVLLILLLNVPGQIVYRPAIYADGKYGPHFGISEHYEHGWPFTYLWRDTMILDHSALLQDLSTWDFFEGIGQFNVLALIANLVVGTAVVLGGGFVFHAWRRRRQRLFQIYISDLFIFGTSLAGCAAVFSFHWSQYRNQQNVLQAIAKVDDTYNEWAIPVRERADWQPGGPTWLRELVGNQPFQVFDRVIGIDVDGEALKYVAGLPHVRVVRICSPVSNQQLSVLEELPQLEALDMCFSTVRNEREEDGDEEHPNVSDYLRLPRMPRLRGLNMYEAAFRGDGLENLRSIEVLDLTVTEMTDQSARQLAQLHHLKDLSLSDTQVTNDGLQYISSLKSLERLWLYSRGIDNHGLKNLLELHELRSLSFPGNELVDVAALKSFPKLEYLALKRDISESGKAELRKALPDCYIP